MTKISNESNWYPNHDGSISITATGCATSLGLSSTEVFAAARAGLTRISPVKCLNLAMCSGFGSESTDGPPLVKGHCVTEIGLGYVDIGKAMVLGQAALIDAMRRVSNRQVARTGLLVLLSDRWLLDQSVIAEQQSEDRPDPEQLPSTQWRRKAQDFGMELARRVELDCIPALTKTEYGCHADLATLLVRAANWLQSGDLDRCVVGGIDSFCEPQQLIACDTLGILKTDDQPAGFIPGEAACFLVLEKSPQIGSAPATCITGIEIDHEDSNLFSDRPPLGRALNSVVHRLAKRIDSNVDFLVGDLNGLERRASDFGHALVRLPESLRSLPVLLPAIAFGETGAAAGFLASGTVCHHFWRNRNLGDRAIVWLASDSGLRSAIAFHRTTSGANEDGQK